MVLISPPFLKDALAEAVYDFRASRKHPPPGLVREFETLASSINGSNFSMSNGRFHLNGTQRNCFLKLSGNQEGWSWTLDKYQHGRRYTSFFADQRTDLNALSLSASGQRAARELLALSPRGEFRVIVGLTSANVSLYGEVAELSAVHEQVLDAMQQLTESFPSAGDCPQTSSTGAITG